MSTYLRVQVYCACVVVAGETVLWEMQSSESSMGGGGLGGVFHHRPPRCLVLCGDVPRGRRVCQGAKGCPSGKGEHLASQNLDQSLTDGLAWRACRAGANHPSEHHLPRETFAAHADDVACPPQECGVNDVAEGREAEVAGQLGSRDAIPLGYVVELPYTLPMIIPESLVGG